MASITMEQVMEQFGDFATGGNTPQIVAWRWVDLGFTPEEAEAWLDARCFSVWAAHNLAAAGITAAQAATETDEGLGSYTDTLGYKVSNEDLVIPQVIAILTEMKD